MSIDPVKIPQNVYIEDRIVGPLTLRQIIIMTFGAGFSYLMYSMVQKAIGTMNIPLTILLWTPAAVAAAFALIQVNDLSLLRICMLILEKTQKPSTRTYTARQGISIVFRTSGAITEEPKKTEAPKQEVNTNETIRTLSAVVDAGSARTAAQEVVPEIKTDAAPKATTPDPVVELPSPLPVDRSAVHADTNTEKPLLSDLSVFRDIFPPNTQWH